MKRSSVPKALMLTRVLRRRATPRGSYFSVKMAGAQLPELIRIARPEEYARLWHEGRIIRRWDAAPEIEARWSLVAMSVSVVS